MTLSRPLPIVVAASLVALFLFPLQAQKGSEGVVLRIRVLDHQTDTALERAQVDVIKFPSQIVVSDFTNSMGQVEFTLEHSDAYIVRATKSGFRDAEITVSVDKREHSVEASIAMDNQEKKSSVPGGDVSARALALPSAAKENFQKGIEALQVKKDPKQAVEFFRKAIAGAPDYYEAYLLSGMAYLQLHSANEAEQSFRKAIELKQDFMNPYYPLALVLFGEKRYDEEERLLSQAMEHDQQNWQWPFEMARSLASHGSWEKALEYGRQAGAKPRASSKVHLLMGDLYSHTGHNAEAIAELEQFKKTDPNSTYIPKVEQALTKLRSAESQDQTGTSPH
jgi:Tfp pilus assembly protein PilF